MINKVPFNGCIGCHACQLVCKTDAIQMTINTEGFVYSRLNKEKCNQCNACLRVCPAINEKFFDRFMEPDVYAAWNKDDETRKNSSSGGLFSEFAFKMLSVHGIVYGAAFDDNFKLQHIGIRSKHEIPNLMGSKYVQSYLADVFREIREYLNKNRQVLFVGTPCQVAGLNSFLRHDYRQLITCDVICHGVSSPGLFAKYIDELENKHHAKVINFQFRAKPKGWRKSFFDIQFDNGSRILEPFTENTFMKGYLADIYLRPSCYQCKYSRLPRVADITLGDFWGIWKHWPEREIGKGVSALLVNSSKGREYLSKANANLILEPAELDWVVQDNPSLIGSVKPHKNRKRFFRLFAKGLPFEISIKKCLPPPGYLDKVMWSINRRLARFLR